MSRGLGNPIWMAKAAVVRVPQYLLVKSIADLFDWLDEVDYGEPLNSWDIIDRLVQVATTGEYKPDPLITPTTFGYKEDGSLTDEEQKIMDRFEQQLMNLPDADEDNNEEEND